MLKKMKCILKSKKGFTLIELIVVIAIIGVLMLLAVPRLTAYQRMAKEQADEQLLVLYRNTFDILLASGQIRNTGSSDVTIDITKTGEAKYGSSSGTLSYRDDSGNYASGSPSTDNIVADSGDGTEDEPTLKYIQNQYISKGGRGGDDIPQLKSEKYAPGLTITITPQQSVSVEITGA